MTGFDDGAEFPADIAYGATGGPGFRTRLVTNSVGDESRNADWSVERGEWNVATGILDPGGLLRVQAHFRARRGRARGFPFKDWFDYDVTLQAIGTGDNVKTTFQLVKIYDDAVNPTTRVITKPKSGTVHVFFDNVEQSSGWTLDYTTGVITFASAVPNGVVPAWTGEFRVPVRYDTDKLAPTIREFNIHEWTNIPIVELRIRS